MEIEFWHLVGLAITVIGGFWTGARVLGAQIEKRLAERFEHGDRATARVESATAALEKEFYALKAEIPREYVRREDYIRGQSVVESKIDALAFRIENLVLKGAMK
ncbi:MAG: hypothetical protein LBI92_02585 [Azoarcus sp.]|nr:hypothetical protein [Azoarcus sp.]